MHFTAVDLAGTKGGAGLRQASLEDATAPNDRLDDALIAAARMIGASAVPMAVIAASERRLVCNDAYARLMEAATLVSTPDLAALHRRMLEDGLAGDTGVIARERAPAGADDGGVLRFDYSPFRNEDGQAIGVFVIPRHTGPRAAAEEAGLTSGGRRRACLIDLGERLRRCDTVGEISGAVSEVLAKALGCTRAGYAVLRGQVTVVEADWTDGSVESLSGEHSFGLLGAPYLDHIRQGRTAAISDVETDPLTLPARDQWKRIQVLSLLNVPLMEDGAPVAMIYAHQREPRQWTADDVLLAQELADRTWEAIGRTRAVDALRRMNGALEDEVRERTIQRDRIWTLSADLMVVTDLDGVIVSVNPAWTRVLGWTEAELVGVPFSHFIHPDDINRTLAARGRLQQGLSIEQHENRYLAKDGRTVWLSWKAVPDGDHIHSVARDVTAEHENAEALRAAEDALRQAQKMEALGQLTGGIAHDFNNLLQGIIGALELSDKLIARGRKAGLAKYNALARECAERAAGLTHRLLAFSRRQPLDPRPVQANSLILGMEPLLRRTLGETIRLKLDLAPDLWTTLCDANQLDSAILNLTINARDAMPNGGVLTIASRNTPGADGDAGEDAICISVSDTGVGMSADMIARAFDPFFTTKPLGQGTGLGLSMVYGFMRQSGGEARITSTLGVGATIDLIFRRHAGEAPLDTAPPPPRRKNRIGQGTVLVVEDEPAVRIFVVDVLQTLGYQVIDAHDGPSGLAILQSPQPIDMLVTDIGLPGLNGRQIAEAARQTRPGLKVLFMTGYAEAAAMPEGFLEPGMELITKPFAIEGLQSRLHQLSPS